MANNEYDNWQDFFKSSRDYSIKILSYGGEVTVQLEEFYQHFKARLEAEKKETINEKIRGLLG